MLPIEDAVLTLLCLVALWWFLFGGYRKNHAERFHEDMVGLRRKMYVWAQQSSIVLDGPAYILLRDTMTYMVSLSVPVMVITFLWNRDTRPETFSRRLAMGYRSLDENARAQLLDCRQKMHLAVLQYLLLSPAIALTIIAPLLAWVIKYRHPTFLTFFEPAFDRLDDVALVKGMESDHLLIASMM